jgi:hypothetical protein
MYSGCTNTYLIQRSVYKYILGVYLYIPGCTALSPVLQDFVEHCVMQNTRVPDLQQQPADPDIDEDGKEDPCQEDEECQDSGKPYQ